MNLSLLSLSFKSRGGGSCFEDANALRTSEAVYRRLSFAKNIVAAAILTTRSSAASQAVHDPNKRSVKAEVLRLGTWRPVRRPNVTKRQPCSGWEWMQDWGMGRAGMAGGIVPNSRGNIIRDVIRGKMILDQPWDTKIYCCSTSNQCQNGIHFKSMHPYNGISKFS